MQNADVFVYWCTCLDDSLDFHPSALGQILKKQGLSFTIFHRWIEKAVAILTKLKSYLVRDEMCAQLVREAEIHWLMPIGKGMISVEKRS
jgi:hypothetical protein